MSARLDAIAGFVLTGRAMADIGTDHALLPAALVERGIVPTAIASDVAAGPIGAARRTLRARDLEDRVILRRADGLAGLRPGEVATVVIAGLGGAAMIEMLSGVSPQGLERLVLSPNGGVAELRRHLDQTGWGIVDEAMIAEAGRLYPIVVAEPGARGEGLDETDIVLGPILRRRRGPAFEQWLRAALQRQQRALDGLRRATDVDATKVRRAEARAGLYRAALGPSP